MPQSIVLPMLFLTFWKHLGAVALIQTQEETPDPDAGREGGGGYYARPIPGPAAQNGRGGGVTTPGFGAAEALPGAGNASPNHQFSTGFIRVSAHWSMPWKRFSFTKVLLWFGDAFWIN